MKRLTIITLLLLSTRIFAQDTHSKPAITTFVQKEDKIILFFSSDNWAKLPSDITSKPFRSRGFSFSFMNEAMNKTGTAGIGFGIGFMSQNVHTNAVLDESKSDSATVLKKIPDSLSYNVNKLSLNFLTASFELRFRTNENKKGERFKLNLGITGALLLQSHTKYSDDNVKYKTFKVKNLNDYQYGLTARVGYSNFALNGYYSMTDVFEKGKGPELIPYSIGIAFTF